MPQALRPRSLFTVAALAITTLTACAPPSPAPSPTTAPTTVGPPTRNIVFPLARSVKYSDTFGAGRSGGRSHEGQDLMAPKGTVAVAAAAGTVTMVRHSSDGLSGNMLRITDPEGWQYVYIHLNNDTPGTDDGANVFEQAFVDGVRQGQQVVPGEPIGYVGDSGNAESTGPHLHFEIRSPDGAAVNAYSSLVAAPVAPLSTAQVEGNAPIGSVDAVVAGAGELHVSGWALDRVVDVSVPVSVYVDGNPKVTSIAKLVRSDLAAAFPGRGEQHGFDIGVAGVSAGSHRVCVIAHNAGAGGSARIGCSTVSVG